MLQPKSASPHIYECTGQRAAAVSIDRKVDECDMNEKKLIRSLQRALDIRLCATRIRRNDEWKFDKGHTNRIWIVAP